MSSETQEKTQNYVNTEHLHYIFVLVIAIMYVITSAITRNPDGDCNFLISIGEYIVNNHKLPTENIWVIHDNFALTVQQWMVCVCNYMFFKLAGYNGILLLSIILVLIQSYVAYKYICVYTSNKKIIYSLLSVSLIMFSQFVCSRPHGFTIILILLEQIALEKFFRTSYSEKNEVKLLIQLGILSFIQMNFHSSMWAMIIIFILPYVVPPILELYDKNNSREKIIALLKSVIVIILAGLINPNFIDGILYVVRGYKNTIGNNLIAEMRPASVAQLPGVFIILTISLLIITVLLKKCNKHLVYTTLGVLILSFMHIRNNWLLIIPIIPLSVIILNSIPAVQSKDFVQSRKLVRNSIVTAYTLTSIGVAIFLLNKITQVEDDTQVFPVSIVEYLNENFGDKKESLRLYTEYDNGAYLELNGYKCYIDSRAEIYEKDINGKEDILDEYMDILSKNSRDVPAFIDKYEFTHIAVIVTTPVAYYLQYTPEEISGYKLVVDKPEKGYRLYEKIDFNK